MEFYVLERRGKGKYCEYDPIECDNLGEAEVCPRCGAFRSSLAWLPPFRATLSNKRCGDLIYGPWIEILFSERIVSEVRRCQFTGIRFEPVEILRESGRHGAVACTSKYFAGFFKLSSVRLDRKQSRLAFDEPVSCEYCLAGVITRIDQITLAQETTSNADFFRILEVPGVLIVSERVVDMMHRLGAVNAEATPLRSFREIFETEHFLEK
jgi:hypothetical protein